MQVRFIVNKVYLTYSLFVILSSTEHLSSSNSTSSSSSNKTDLLSGAGTPPDCGGLSNMLMITSSVRMFNGIHSNTTNLWPAVPLHFVFVVSTTSFQDRFVNTSRWVVVVAVMMRRQLSGRRAWGPQWRWL